MLLSPAGGRRDHEDSASDHQPTGHPPQDSYGHTPMADSCAVLVGVDQGSPGLGRGHGPALVRSGSSEATDVGVMRASCRAAGLRGRLYDCDHSLGTVHSGLSLDPWGELVFLVPSSKIILILPRL